MGLGETDFVGKLYNKEFKIKGLKVKNIEYIKRSDKEREKLRREFDSTEREKFVKKLANEQAENLRKAGITDDEIALMNDGLLPSKDWQVHHKRPLDDSGTNTFENLVLIRNHPYHKAITNYQNEKTRDLNENDKNILKFPIPDGMIFPKERDEEFEKSIQPNSKRKKKTKKEL